MASTQPASLLDTCRASMLDGTYDLSRLEALPTTVLAQLVQACVADKLAAQAQHEACTTQLAALTKDRYRVEAPRPQGRVDPEAYERVARVVAKWEPQPCNWDGMVSHQNWSHHCKELVYCRSKSSYELLPCEQFQGGRAYRGGDYLDIYRVISSALLFYRLCCLFAAQVEVAGPNRYKCVWSVQLRHRATGDRVGLDEHKGAAGVEVSCFDGPAEFECDLVELMNLLCDDKCPHLQDGCVDNGVA